MTNWHLRKASADSYEKKLRAILVAERGLSIEEVNRSREQYLSSCLETSDSQSICGFPTTVNVELVNKCNYKCAMCYTVNHEGEGVELSFAHFKKLVDECKAQGLTTMFIANGSEPLIKKDFRDYLVYATSVIPDVAVFTNGVKLDKEMAEFICMSGVTRLNISLDAATPDTYRSIRGGDLELIESKIRYLLSIRTSLGRPLVRVSFCVQPGNVHEVDLFRRKWESLVDSVEFQQLHQFTNLDSMTTVTQDTFFDASFDAPYFCSMPFSYLAVWSNGNISPCCSFHGSKIVMGNISNTSLLQAWSSPLARSLRQSFIDKKTCAQCNDCLSNSVDLLSGERS